MSQRLLERLGNLAHLSRSIGLGSLLSASRDLIDCILARANKPLLKVEEKDFVIYGYLRHRSFLEQISKGKYEPFSRYLFERVLKPDVLVVDAGAHLGLYSLLAAPRLGNRGRIFAFEPDYYNFRALMFNIIKNHCKNMVPIQKALSNTIGIASFYESPGTISSSLIRRKNIGKTMKASIPATTLDNELQGQDIYSIVIKLDVEGAELMALEGMSNILQRANSVVLIAEMNPSALHDAGANSKSMIDDLRKYGFCEIYIIDELNKKLIPVTSLDIPRKGNLYCLKAY